MTDRGGSSHRLLEVQVNLVLKFDRLEIPSHTFFSILLGQDFSLRLHIFLVRGVFLDECFHYLDGCFQLWGGGDLKALSTLGSHVWLGVLELGVDLAFRLEEAFLLAL